MLTNAAETIETRPQPQRRVNVPMTPPQAAVEPTSLSIVQAALASGNVEMYREAVALVRDMDAFEARKAFNAALAAARAKIPVIKKNRRVGFDSKRSGGGRTDYAFEDMAEIARTVDPILSQHGLFYRFRSESEINQPVRVTCIIFHKDGHSEETTLTATRDDDNSNKNSIQRLGSTTTYLQRYTLKMALGLSASEDDDGTATARIVEEPERPGCINQAQAEEIRRLLDENGFSLRGFLQRIRLARIEDIGVEHFDKAVALIKNVGRK